MNGKVPIQGPNGLIMVDSAELQRELDANGGKLGQDLLAQGYRLPIDPSVPMPPPPQWGNSPSQITPNPAAATPAPEPVAPEHNTPPVMGDVKQSDAAFERPSLMVRGGRLVDRAITPVVEGMSHSRATKYLIPPDELQALHEDNAEKAQKDPNYNRWAQVVGESLTPESQLAGTLAGPFIKAPIQARALNEAGKKVFGWPQIAPVVQKVKGGVQAAKLALENKLKMVAPQVSAKTAAQQVAPGIGTAVGMGAGVGLSTMGGGGAWGGLGGTELGAIIGNAAGRTASGMSTPIAKGLGVNTLTTPFVDLGKAAASLSSPAVQFQTAKMAPWLARWAGMPHQIGDE
jgi:hypothetical protein